MNRLGRLSEEDLEERLHRRRRRVRLLGFFLVLFLALSLFGERGLLQIYKMQKTQAELQKEIRRLERSIEALSREAQALRDHPEQLEELAREALGLVRPGEIVYQFSPPKEPKKVPP